MNLENEKLNSLGQKDREALGFYIKHMQRLVGEDIFALTVYGSVVKDNFFPGASDINVFLIVKRISPEIIQKVASTVKRFQRANKISTFLTDVNHIKDAADVFPIKYLDVKRHHCALIGPDLFEGMEIEVNNLRNDLEMQLRNLIFRISREYVLSSYTAGDLRNILVTNFSGFSHLLSALLILKGQEPPAKKEEIIKDIARVFNLDLEVLEQVLKLKRGGNNPLKQEMQYLFDSYFHIVEKIIEIVDKMKVE
ncbi:MAG: hypothetical protein ACLFQV_01350 [Vulcanimicrobiota bacterium]